MGLQHPERFPEGFENVVNKTDGGHHKHKVKPGNRKRQILRHSPKDPDALYKAMKTLLESPDLYAKLCKGVREKRTLFDKDVWVDRFVDFCRQAVALRREGRRDTISGRPR